MDTRGGGWAYILNRFDASLDFGQKWQSYKQGFGVPDEEVWLGLENIHHLTGSGLNELLIELVNWDLTKVYALYSSFSVAGEKYCFL